jgi:succinyl-CoA synthetase beta subunit
MKLFEYQSMGLLAEYGIPTPRYGTASDRDEACRIAESLGGRSVVKAQVLAGGRGKAGGVKLAGNAGEAGNAAVDILAMTIQDMKVKKVIVSQRFDIAKEFYLGCVVNRDARSAEIIFSGSGGIDIEEISVTAPEKIIRIPADPAAGLDETAVMKGMAAQFENSGLLDQAVSITKGLYRLFSEKDCSLVEINPLALLADGRGLVAADAKIVIDDNALFRHPEREAMRNPDEESRDESDARKAGLSFVSMDGYIGCMVNGAGLAMATMDLIRNSGGEAANFLDVGGSSNPQKVVDAVDILLRNKKIRAILMNIFGGITRCDDIAKGVIMARDRIGIPVPFVIRLIGTNDVEAREMLAREGFQAHEDLTSAVRMAVRAARGEGM